MSKPLVFNKRLNIKITIDDHRRWRAHAKKKKIQISELVRRSVNDAISRGAPA